MFCFYAVVAVTFTYFYQLTFFAGIMVYMCRRETENRHCLTFKQIPPVPSQFRHTHTPSRSWFALHIYKDHLDFPKLPPPRYSPTPLASLNMRPARGPKGFWTVYADFLLKPWVQRLILLLFIAYLVISLYGCKHVKIGMEPKDLLPDNSYGKRALKIAEQYFDNGGFLHVWMFNLSTTNIGHRRLWSVLKKEILLYEFTEYTGPADSWLKSFFDYNKKNELILNRETFVPLLKNFLKEPQYVKYRRLDLSGHPKRL